MAKLSPGRVANYYYTTKETPSGDVDFFEAVLVLAVDPTPRTVPRLKNGTVLVLRANGCIETLPRTWLPRDVS